MKRLKRVAKPGSSADYSIIIGALSASLVVAFAITGLLLSMQFAVHESGHFLGCYAGAFIQGKQVRCGYTNSASVPILPPFLSLQVPQQTSSTDASPSLLFALGGPAWSTLFICCLAFLGWKYLKIKSKVYWLVPALLLLTEAYNILCGTDHPGDVAFPFCGIASQALQAGGIALILVIAYLVYPEVKKRYLWLVVSIRKRRLPKAMKRIQ